VAAPNAPVLGGKGDVALAAEVFAAEVKPHLVHEAVRAEQSARRAGTRGVKSRGLVAGGRAKPWRQKGTGRARAGTTRAPQFTGGGVAFAVGTSFGQKVNRKAAKAALRSALADHAGRGTVGILDGSTVEGPSTKWAASLLGDWGQPAPRLVIAAEEEEALIKSFRNLPDTIVTVPSELDVSSVVWARSLLVSQAALPLVEGRAS
jgi:large subunit ribosomal protein L4